MHITYAWQQADCNNECNDLLTELSNSLRVLCCLIIRPPSEHHPFASGPLRGDARFSSVPKRNIKFKLDWPLLHMEPYRLAYMLDTC